MLIMAEMNFGCRFIAISTMCDWYLLLRLLLENLVGIRIIGCGRAIPGDFSVFRIYADKKNEPADYSPDNVPYHPSYVAPVSLDGYKEGSFCMTLGYPGSTERFLSSFGIEEMMNGMNQAMIDVRGVKQAIWKREMDRRDDIRIKYASKYDESSNYWKNSIGTNKAIRKLKVLEKKRELEATLRQWIQNTPAEREKLMHLALFARIEL